jgi:hypothetical protein
MDLLLRNRQRVEEEIQLLPLCVSCISVPFRIALGDDLPLISQDIPAV